MGSYYYEYVSDRDPTDDCYDWPITGVPGTQLAPDGLDFTPNADFSDERWKETSLRGVWVSNYGRFYDTEKQSMMAIHPMKNGYMEVKKYYDGKQHHLTVHRAMAEAFIDNPYNDPVVRHLSGNRADNVLEGLAWGTHKENAQDAIEGNTFYRLTEEDRAKAKENSSRGVIATRLATGEELNFKSMHDAARELGLHVETICNLVNGKSRCKTTGGYTFKAANNQ